MEMRVNVSGCKELTAKLEQLPAKVQNVVLKKAVKSGSKVIEQAEKSQAPSESGLLKQSLGATSVKSYGTTIFSTVGARRGFRRAVVATKSGGVKRLGKKASAALSDANFRDPTKYLHIIERGRKAIDAQEKILYSPVMNRFFGRQVAGVSANPFIERAFETAADAAVGVIQSETVEGINNL
jgi:HK97 gp10 family phage protein